MARRPVLASLVLILAAPAAAQRYDVRVYSENEGLPSSIVYGIAQDPKGLLWFGTRSGVASYDGSVWTTHQLGDRLAPANPGLLATDRGGIVWGVTRGLPFRVARLVDGAWSALPPAPESASTPAGVTALAVLESGGEPRVAVGTTRGLFVWDGRRWRTVGVRDGLPSEEVLAVVADGDHLLVGTRAGGATWAPGSGVGRVNGLDGVPEVAALAPDPGGPFVFQGGGLSRLEGGRLVRLSPEVQLAAEETRGPITLVADRRGGCVVGSDHAIRWFSPGEPVLRLDHGSGLPGDGATSLLVDREGLLWIATVRGVARVGSRRFASYTVAHGLAGDEVTAVLHRSDGMLVVGHHDALTLVRGERMQRIPLEPRAYGSVLELAEDRAGNVWIAGGTRQLGRLDPAGRLAWLTGDEIPAAVSSVLVDRTGSIWLTGPDLFRLVGRRAELRTGGVGYVRRIVEGRRTGLLYLGSARSGLAVGDGRTWRRLGGPTTEGSESVYAVLEAGAADVWVGTAAGLYRVVDDRLVLPEPPLRIDRPVFSLAEDLEGRLWFGTDNGVFRWDGAALHHFTIEDGVLGRETNRAALAVDRAGQVWIGTDQGLTVYRPRLDEKASVRPTPELLSLLVNGREEHPVARLELGHDENDLVFRLRAVSFRDERRLRYRTRLVGDVETPWRLEAGGTRIEVAYPKVPPGRLVLEMQAASGEGEWGDVTRSGAIVVARPPWRQPLFLPAVLLAFAACVLLVHRSVFRRQYARRLEEEVKARTAELRESERRYRRMFDESPAVLLVVDPVSGELVDASPAARVFYGPELLAAGRFPDLVEEGPERPEPGYATARHRRASGGVRDVEVYSGPVQIEGKELLLSIVHDITDRRRLEAELAKAEKLEGLSLMAGGIAHDLNNVLMALSGNLELLRPEVKSPEGRETLSHAMAPILRAQRLAGRLLTFARGGAPMRNPVAVKELIRANLVIALSGSNVRPEVTYGEGLLAVDVDEAQIGQALSNILLNARQAMPEGGTVHVRAENVERPPAELPPGRYVRIEVRDEGPGIPPESLPRLFDPFFTTKVTGHGLGLSTAFSIVKKHGGLIGVTSPPGGGAVFEVILPATETEPARPAPPAGPQAGEGSILFLDDEEPLRRVVSRMLTRIGYRVTTARDGQEAVDLFQTAELRGEPFDAVVFDLTIPGGLGGLEALRMIRKVRPDVPAIVASGYSEDAVLADPTAYGFSGRVAKPFTGDALGAELARVLEGKTGRRLVD